MTWDLKELYKRILKCGWKIRNYRIEQSGEATILIVPEGIAHYTFITLVPANHIIIRLIPRG